MANRRKFVIHKMPGPDRPAADLPPVRERCFGDGLFGGDKARFGDEAEARAEADRIFREGGDRLAVYPCEHCQGWHFTSGRRGRGIVLTDRETDRRRRRHKVRKG